MKRIFIFLTFLFPALSCTVLTVVKKINTTKVDVITFESSNKTVKFIPMAHIGKQEFYDGVYGLVDSLKRSGFVSFHEGTIKKPLSAEIVAIIYDRVQRSPVAKYYLGSGNKDSIAQDIYHRKLRRMFGFLPDSSKYMDYFSKMGMFEDLVDQPRFYELKTDEKDLNIDVSLFDMIDEYERRFGTIELKETEFAADVRTRVEPSSSEKLPWSNVKEIILDYRDRFLAEQIHNSPHQKIVVIYGLAHLEGTFKYLQSLDNSWTTRKN